MVDGTEKTNRENLKQVAKTKKINPETLYKLPEIPDSIRYILEWFYQLKKTSDPIIYSEIKAWSDLTGNRILPEEVDAIMQIDFTYNFQNQTKKDK